LRGSTVDACKTFARLKPHLLQCSSCPARDVQVNRIRSLLD